MAAGRRRMERLARLLHLLERRKALTIAEAAMEFQVSYKHFRYYVLPELRAMSECVGLDGEKILWDCE